MAGGFWECIPELVLVFVLVLFLIELALLQLNFLFQRSDVVLFGIIIPDFDLNSGVFPGFGGGICTYLLVAGWRPVGKVLVSVLNIICGYIWSTLLSLSCSWNLELPCENRLPFRRRSFLLFSMYFIFWDLKKVFTLKWLSNSSLLNLTL